MKKVVRTNKWHSVLVQVRKVPIADGGGKEIRIAADQDARWNGTYLTVQSARELAAVLLKAAYESEGK